jgi:virginiamycin A acetyltransferase
MSFGSPVRARGDTPELRRSVISCALRTVSLARPLRRVALLLALRLEGGEFYSATARDVIAARYGVQIGAYSYGHCFVPGAFRRGTTFGRYVSVGPMVEVLARNHPLDRLSTHPFFFNARLGYVAQDNVPSTRLTVGHDAWLGFRAVITSGCARIGIGAVVGAGAVVTKVVPDFAVVAGVPARIIKYRFPPVLRERILASEWWLRSAEDCANLIAEMVQPLDPDAIHHPLLVPLERA